MPLLLEDFQDLLFYRPLVMYFSSIVPNVDKKNEFAAAQAEGIQRL